MQKAYVIIAILSLLVSAFIDNLRGPLFPVIREELHLPYSLMSWLLVAGYIAAGALSFASVSAFKHVSQKSIGIVSCVLTFVACVFAGWVKDFSTLVVFAGLLGIAIFFLGTCCNVFIIKGAPPGLRAKALAGMHTMYGLGSMVAAASVSMGLQAGWHWSSLFYVSILGVALLLAFVILKLPHEKVLTSSPETHAHAPPRFLTKSSLALLACSCCYVGAEVGCSTWMAPFLVDYHHLSPTQASWYVFGYFLVLMGTRFLCFLVVKPQNINVLLKYSILLSAICYSLGYFGFLPGLFLAGTLGPFFPLLIARSSAHFSSQWHVLVVWIMSTMQGVLCFMHLGLGKLADNFGIRNAFLVPGGFFFLTLVFLFVYLRLEKRDALL